MEKRGASKLLLIILIISLIIIITVTLIFLPKSVYDSFLDSIKSNSSATLQQVKECKLEEAKWLSGLVEIQNAKEGERIAISVKGEKCSSIPVTIKVFDSNGNLIQNLEEKKFIRERATAFWYSTPGIFYFEASHDFDLIKSPEIEIIPKSQETITTSGQTSQSSSGGGSSGGGSSSSNSGSSCIPPKYTTKLENPKACDYRLMQQNEYTKFNLSELGMNSKAWSLNGGHLLAHGYPLETVLAFTKEDIEKNFNKYLNAHPELKWDTTDLINIDIEEDLFANKIEEYYGNDSELQKKVMEAIKIRIEVVREALPNAKIVLWNTPNVNNWGDKNNPSQLKQMIGHKKMGEAGVYDQVDYFMTNLYVRYLPSEGPLFYTYENMTILAIESAMELKNSKGENLPIVAAMGVVMGTNQKKLEPILPEVSQKMISIINKYDDIKIVTYWAGHDNYAGFDVLGILENIAPIPVECFCPTSSSSKSGN